MNPPSEGSIQLTLFRNLWDSSRLIVPNFVPAGWFEADMWRITREGYAVEYEIKRTWGNYKQEETQKAEKHRRLLNRDTQGPTRFFYVVPPELASLIKREIAGSPYGLYVVNECRGTKFIKVLPAQNLHRTKVPFRQLSDASRRFHKLFWAERRRRVAFEEDETHTHTDRAFHPRLLVNPTMSPVNRVRRLTRILGRREPDADCAEQTIAKKCRTETAPAHRRPDNKPTPATCRQR